MVFDLVEKDQIMIGEPFDVTVTANNKSEEERTVKVTMTATVVFYTGVPVKVIKKETYNVKAPAGSCKSGPGCCVYRLQPRHLIGILLIVAIYNSRSGYAYLGCNHT